MALWVTFVDSLLLCRVIYCLLCFFLQWIYICYFSSQVYSRMCSYRLSKKKKKKEEVLVWFLLLNPIFLGELGYYYSSRFFFFFGRNMFVLWYTFLNRCFAVLYNFVFFFWIGLAYLVLLSVYILVKLWFFKFTVFLVGC